MLSKEVAANIKAARKAFPTPDKKGLSLEKLAARMKPAAKYQTLQKLENAKIPVTMDWIERIALALDIDPIELIDPGREAIAATPSFHLDEQAAGEVARTLTGIALKTAEPDSGTVQVVALALQEILRTFSEDPEAARDPKMARLTATLVGRRFVPAAN